MQVSLYYRLPECRKTAKKIIKVAKAIVAGHERAMLLRPEMQPASATLKGTLLRLNIPAQLAESADWWMNHASNIWQPEFEGADSLKMMNNYTLIWRCNAILMPDSGPNGSYVLRNGGIKSATSTVIPQASASRFKIKSA